MKIIKSHIVLIMCLMFLSASAQELPVIIPKHNAIKMSVRMAMTSSELVEAITHQFDRSRLPGLADKMEFVACVTYKENAYLISGSIREWKRFFMINDIGCSLFENIFLRKIFMSLGSVALLSEEER